MSISGVLMFLGISCAVAAYLIYALAPVPSDIEDRNAVFWIFVKHKSSRGIVSLNG